MSPLTNAPPPPESADDFPRLSEYMGRVLCLTPTGRRTITTTYGTKDVLDATAWCLTERQGKLSEVGSVSIFGKALQAQVGDESGSFTVGRLIMGGRNGKRQELAPVDDETLKLIDGQLTDF